MFNKIVQFIPTFFLLALCLSTNIHGGIVQHLGMSNSILISITSLAFIFSLLIYDFDKRYIAVVLCLFFYANFSLLNGQSYKVFELILAIAVTFTITPKLLSAIRL